MRPAQQGMKASPRFPEVVQILTSGSRSDTQHSRDYVCKLDWAVEQDRSQKLPTCGRFIPVALCNASYRADTVKSRGCCSRRTEITGD